MLSQDIKSQQQKYNETDFIICPAPGWSGAVWCKYKSGFIFHITVPERKIPWCHMIKRSTSLRIWISF